MRSFSVASDFECASNIVSLLENFIKDHEDEHACMTMLQEITEAEYDQLSANGILG